MNTIAPAATTSIESELQLDFAWDSQKVRDLIDRKSSEGRSPAFFFLGRHEAGLLRGHLAESFGEASVASFKNLYYMGLEVIELEMESFLRTAGMKRIKTFRDLNGRRLHKSDAMKESFWSFEI